MRFLFVPLILLCVLFLAGCQHAVRDQVAPSPSEPWQPTTPQRGVLGQVPTPAVVEAFRARPSPTRTLSDGPVGHRAMTLAEAFDLALANNPETRRTWQLAKARAAELNQAKAGYYPEIGFRFDLTRSENDSGQPENPLNPDTTVTENRYGPAFSVSWLLYDFGEREHTVAAAEAATAAANQGFNQTLQATLLDTAEAYFRLAGAIASLEADEAFRANAEATLSAAEQRLENDLGTRPDVLRARADLRTAEADLAQDRAEIESARAQLARALGVQVSAGIKIVALDNVAELPLPASDVSALIAAALERRPLLRQSAASITAAEEAFNAARAATAPELVFSGTAQWSDGTNDRTAETHFYSAGLALQWNLFQGFRRRFTIAQRRSELEQVRESALRSELEVISDVWSSYFGWQGAQERLKATSAAVEARAEALEAIRRSYETGLSSLLDLLEAQQDLAEAEQSQVEAAADLGTSRARLAFAVGRLESPPRSD